MADFNSSLPVRTENPGDVIVKVADATTPSQQTTVDSSGNLHVFESSAGPVTPGSVAINSDLIGGQYNILLPTLSSGQQAAVQVDSSGRLIIRPLTSSDTVSVIQSTSPWITKDQSDGQVARGSVASFSHCMGGQYIST